jgi:hypothetical protein
MEEILNLINSFGIPSVVLAWFMLRAEKIIGKNTEAIDKLKDSIELFFKKN